MLQNSLGGSENPWLGSLLGLQMPEGKNDTQENTKRATPKPALLSPPSPGLAMTNFF